MNVTQTKLSGVMIIEPVIHSDDRGLFLETFNTKRYYDLGIRHNFVQDNFSRSKKGVLRGLHFQKNVPLGKLVSCTQGLVYDVVVDIDPESDSFGSYIGVELSEHNRRQLWVPPGYAHGFCVLSDTADFHYKCTSFYDPDDEGALIWNDPEIAVDWPIENPVLSIKDQRSGRLTDILTDR